MLVQVLDGLFRIQFPANISGKAMEHNANVWAPAPLGDLDAGPGPRLLVSPVVVTVDIWEGTTGQKISLYIQTSPANSFKSIFQKMVFIDERNWKLAVIIFLNICRKQHYLHPISVQYPKLKIR